MIKRALVPIFLAELFIIPVFPMEHMQTADAISQAAKKKEEERLAAQKKATDEAAAALKLENDKQNEQRLRAEITDPSLAARILLSRIGDEPVKIPWRNAGDQSGSNPPPPDDTNKKSLIHDNRYILGAGAAATVIAGVMYYNISHETDAWFYMKYNVMGRYEKLNAEKCAQEAAKVKKLQEDLKLGVIGQKAYDKTLHRIVGRYHPQRRHEITDLVK